jgi:hypothetical protein
MRGQTTETIPILWSDDIRVDVLTPLAILRTQTEPLRRMTEGRLEAHVTTTTIETRVVHNLDMIAAALEQTREKILSISHNRTQVYPADVESAVPSKPRGPAPPIRFDRSAASSGATASTFEPSHPDVKSDEWELSAATHEELIRVVGSILRSPEVRSLVQSPLSSTFR